METKINLELKHFCEDFAPVRKVLQDLKAQREETVSQMDFFFYLPERDGDIQPRLKLRVENNTQTLIYYSRADFVEGKSTPADVKLYDVRDTDFLPFLKEVLGIKAVVEKVRERWRRGNIVFNLDQVKDVGKIFEIEITTTEEKKNQDEKVFADLREKLIPYLGGIVKGSNVDLVLRTQKKH